MKSKHPPGRVGVGGLRDEASRAKPADAR